MEKESYSIDDILSEVKKRREENERELKGEGAPSPDGGISTADSSAGNAPEDAEIIKENEPQTDGGAQFGFIEKNSQPGEETEEKTTVFRIEEDEPSDYRSGDGSDNAQQAVEENEKPEPPEEKLAENEEAEPEKQQERKNPEKDSVVSDNQQKPEAENGMVDLLALAEEKEEEQQELAQAEQTEEKVKFIKTKKGKIVTAVIVILVVLIAAAAVFAVWYVNNVLDKVTQAEPYEKVSYYDGMDFLQEDFPTIDELSAGEISSYKEYLKQWYLNGDPVSSTHVMNVLLIGEDTREEEISDSSRADSAIIASINIDTGEIHLTSILRDLYVYFEVDGQEHYDKINAAASLGGMKCYINTIERYYKISIDNYAVVNFASFPKIIDSLGGVTIKLTSAEIYEINNHPSRYGNVTITQSFEGTEGNMKLNGEQALAYCRIRKIDSDGARANRQKTVLNAIFKKMKSSGTVDIVKTVNSLIDYVYTGFEKNELIEIGNTALKDNWLDYEVKTRNIPSTENCKGGQRFSAAPGVWIWLSDIPEDAYNLQMEIYGKSNINLNENRADYIALGR